MAMLRLSTVDVDLDTGAVGEGRLATSELALLAWLARHPGQDVSRDRLLREVWGFPGQPPETRAVDLAIARLRKKVERDPGRPDHLITVQGVGYRFVPLDVVPNAPLPRPANRHVGRAPELARLRAVLQEGARLVTLVGPGGVGKTRLALEIAAERPGAVFCDACEARDGGSLAATLHAALSPGGAGGHPTLGPLLGTIGSRTVVLDNVEQIAAAAAEAIPGWLARAEGLVLVVTSREALGLPDEHLVDLVPWLGDRADEGIALLVERARQLDVTLDPADPEVAALVARMDGLPLGIELAAARLRTRKPAEIAQELGGVRRGVPARHASLDRAVAWSWELLGDDEVAGLVTLAELRGTWPLSAADALGVPSALVDRLVERSMVQRYPQTGRWGLLDAVRRFARAMGGDRAGIAERHARWCAADGASPSLADLEAAMAQTVAGSMAEIAPRLLRLRQRLTAAAPLDRFEQVVRALLPNVPDLRVSVTLQVDVAAAQKARGDVRGAIATLTEARARAVPPFLSMVEGNLASAHLRAGAYGPARALAMSAAEGARRDGVPRGLALRLQLVAGIELLAGNLEASDAGIDEALTAAEGLSSAVGSLLHLRARVRHARGERAEIWLDAAEPLLADAPWMAVLVRVLRIEILQDRVEWSAARALLPDLDALGPRYRDDLWVTSGSAIAHARDRWAQGDVAEARTLLALVLAAADNMSFTRAAYSVVSMLPRDRAWAMARAELVSARQDGRRYDTVRILAGWSAHPEATADERDTWRIEGLAICDAMGVLPEGWLRRAFAGPPWTVQGCTR